MKKYLSINLLLWTIVMALGAISLTSCSDDPEDVPDFVTDVKLGSKVYMFRYNEECTYIREIIDSPYVTVPKNYYDYGNESPDNPDYVSKSYMTHTGYTLEMIYPKIDIIVEEGTDIDSIIARFGDKLSFRKTIAGVYIYNCHVKNSDEVLDMVTILAKDSRVTGCEASFPVKIELFSINKL